MTDWHFFELLLLLSLFSQEAPSKKIKFFSVLFRKFLPVIVDNIERITVLTVFLHYHWLFGSGILGLGLDLLLNKIRLRHWYYYYCDFNYLRLKIKNSIGHSPFFLFSKSIPFFNDFLYRKNCAWEFERKCEKIGDNKLELNSARFFSNFNSYMKNGISWQTNNKLKYFNAKTIKRNPTSHFAVWK